MISALLISTFIALFSTVYSASLATNEFVLIERKRSLQKNLLSNLQAHQTGVAIEIKPQTNEFNEIKDAVADEDVSSINPRKRVRMDYNSGFSNIFPFDLQQNILTFLTPQDLLITRQVSRLYCNMSN